MEYAFNGIASNGAWRDDKGTLHFAMDGVEVSLTEFLQRFHDTLLQNDALRTALQTVLRELQNHGNIGDDELCKIVNGALSGSSVKREQGPSIYNRREGECIDCGKPVSSGNICVPCIRVRYPSGEDRS